MIKNRYKKDRPKPEKHLNFLTNLGAEFILRPREITAEEMQELSPTELNLLPDTVKAFFQFSHERLI